MKNGLLIFSILAMLLLVFSNFNVVLAEGSQGFTKICVPTAETALEIAKIVCRAVYPDREFDYDNGIAYLNTSTDEWYVWFDVIGKKTGDFFGGGYPEIHVKRINAEITYLFLQK